MKRVTLRNL